MVSWRGWQIHPVVLVWLWGDVWLCRWSIGKYSFPFSLYCHKSQVSPPWPIAPPIAANSRPLMSLIFSSSFLFVLVDGTGEWWMWVDQRFVDMVEVRWVSMVGYPWGCPCSCSTIKPSSYYLSWSPAWNRPSVVGCLSTRLDIGEKSDEIVGWLNSSQVKTPEIT